MTAGLDIEIGRRGPPPRDAATLIVVRDGASGLEVFCVERAKQSRFLGGAIVFPGGKLDASDRDPSWASRSTPMAASAAPMADGDDMLRGLGVAACREALEEAAILPVAGGALAHAEVLALRERIAAGGASGELLAFLESRGLALDLAGLRPFARWVTPEAESRRFDARFFLASAPPGQDGAHDDFETKASFWAPPANVLARFDTGDVALAPPTHRTLEMLAAWPDVGAAMRGIEGACLDVVCPRLVKHVDARGETLALALPGDPDHDVAARRVPGATRFVLRGERWCPEDAPGAKR